jgi:hypothetical protein
MRAPPVVIPLVMDKFITEGTMRLTPPTNYAFYSSIVLAVFALALYFAGAVGLVENTLHFAFWIAIAAWLWLFAGVVARGV